MCLNSSTHSEFSRRSTFAGGGASFRDFALSVKVCFFFLRNASAGGYVQLVDNREGGRELVGDFWLELPCLSHFIFSFAFEALIWTRELFQRELRLRLWQMHVLFEDARIVLHEPLGLSTLRRVWIYQSVLNRRFTNTVL